MCQLCAVILSLLVRRMSSRSLWHPTPYRLRSSTSACVNCSTSNSGFILIRYCRVSRSTRSPRKNCLTSPQSFRRLGTASVVWPIERRAPRPDKTTQNGLKVGSLQSAQPEMAEPDAVTATISLEISSTHLPSVYQRLGDDLLEIAIVIRLIGRLPDLIAGVQQGNPVASISKHRVHACFLGAPYR